MEDMCDQCEEVAQSTLFQGSAYGNCAVSFAQDITRYMWVGHCLVSSRWVWLLSQTFVRYEPMQGLKLVQCQFNTEPAKIDAFQFDTVCHDRECQFLAIELNRSQLLLKFQKIGEDSRTDW